MSETFLKSELFTALGYGGSHELLDQALEQAGLSRPSKSSIVSSKRRAVEELLAAHFVAICGRGDCQSHAGDEERTVVPAATSAHCAICHGSPNARAVDGLVDALAAAGVNRLCVVGGSPTSHTTLARMVAGRIELRLVDGTGSRSGAPARADLGWADIVVIWGSTMLDHRVSLLYRGPHVVQMARRGIRDLAGEVAAAVATGGGRRGFRR